MRTLLIALTLSLACFAQSQLPTCLQQAVRITGQKNLAKNVILIKSVPANLAPLVRKDIGAPAMFVVNHRLPIYVIKGPAFNAENRLCISQPGIQSHLMAAELAHELEHARGGDEVSAYDKQIAALERYILQGAIPAQTGLRFIQSAERLKRLYKH